MRKRRPTGMMMVDGRLLTRKGHGSVLAHGRSPGFPSVGMPSQGPGPQWLTVADDSRVSQLRDSPRFSRGSLLVRPHRVGNHGKMFMSKYLARSHLVLFTLQRYTHSPNWPNKVLNSKLLIIIPDPLRTPPDTHPIRPFSYSSYILLIYFLYHLYKKYMRTI